MTDLHATYEVAGETLTLLPELAIYWGARHTLFVADTHFGKSATFRAEGLPVPHGTTAHALSRLDDTTARYDVARIIFLGDFLHAAQGRTPGTLDALAGWRDALCRARDVELVLVRGNHDRHAGDPPAALGITCVKEPLIDGPFALRHHPRETPGSYTLSGHLHPAATLTGAGRQRLRLPCFWFGPSVCVLPAFGDFTGQAEIRAGAGDAVFVVADDRVVRVSAPTEQAQA
jgi:DNA ligase-associated metallophosphoesterase